MKKQWMQAPCNQCPLSKNCLRGWLGEKRIKEILASDSFVCHKTITGVASDQRQCAGHMILKGLNNSFVRVAGFYEIDLELKGEHFVFDSEQECINHHK